MKAYARSKLANVLYTRDLAAELASAGVTVNALHPGMVATDIWDGAPWFARPVLALIKRFKMITRPEAGCTPNWRTRSKPLGDRYPRQVLGNDGLGSNGDDRLR